MDELKEKLKFTECPFNWGLSNVKDRKSASFIIDRLLEKDEEISEPWCHACILLTISYLHFENGDYLKAVGSLKEGEELISKSNNGLIARYKTAFQTVYHASKAVYLSYVSTPSEVQQYYEKIVPIQNLNTGDQAAVSAIKANVLLEFGVSGSLMASNFAKEAIQKNPTEADWHFLMGKLLGRIRHFGQDHDITPAELSHLQTAFNLNQTPRAAIYLANCYIEKSKSLVANSYKNENRPSQMTRAEVKNLTSEAKKLIKFALDKNKDQCVHILIRCAFGLTKLPRSDRDYVLAKQLLDQSLKRSPSNPMANKLAGDICLQEEKPLYHKALKHFEAAAAKNVYSANFSIFEIQVKLSLNQDPETFYAKMIEHFTEKNYQLLTLLHATEYYLFIKRDLITAVQYFLKAINLDKNFHALTDRWVKYVQKNVNLYELIGNDARYAIKEQMYSNPDQMKTLQKVCKEISDIKPDLMRIPVVMNKVQMYLETYQIGSNNVMRGRDGGSAGTEGRGRGRGRGGRGRGRGRGRGGRGSFIFQKENSNKSLEINFPEKLYNPEICNNRMAGASRSRNRSSSRNRSLPRHGENDQRCIKNSENIPPTYFDKTQFDRITYSGNQFDEVMENPYFIKFLELQYKKLDNSESFKEWLLKYNGNNSSNPRNEIFTSEKTIAGKSDDKLDVLIGMINQLKEEINEIKLNDSRSCYSYQHSKKCHSLKSLQCDMLDRIKKPEEYYNEQGKKYKKAFLPDKKMHRSETECRPDYFKKVDNFHNRMPSPRQEDNAYRYSHNRFQHEYVDKKKRYIRSRSRDSCSDRSLSNSSRKSDSSFKYLKENRDKGGYDYDRKQNYHSSHYRDKDINKACSSKGWRGDKRHSKKDFEGHYSSSSSGSSDSRSHEKSEERKYYNIDKLRYQKQMYDDLKNEYGDKKGSEKSGRRNERKSSCKDIDYYVHRHHKKRSEYKSLSPEYTGYDDNSGNEDSFRHGKIKSTKFVGKNEGNKDSCLSDSCQSRSSRESNRQKKQHKINPLSKDYSKKNRTDKHSYERMSRSKKELKKHSEVLDSQTKKFYDVERANDRQREKSSFDKNSRNENDRNRDSMNNSSGNAMLEREHFNKNFKSSKKSDLKHKPVNLKNEELTVITKQGETMSRHENTSLSSSEEEQLCVMKKKSDKVKLNIGSSSYKREASDVETGRKTGDPIPWDEYEKTSSG